MQPVSPFSLDRYLGTWYEIARLPNSFEKDLTNVTATYSINKNGMVKVLNSGFNTRKQKQSTAIGKAKFAEKNDIGHLRVSFFWVFYGDYIVLDLDSEYHYALVASSHKYLWILSRTRILEQSILDRLIDKARKNGFDTDKLYFTPQDR